MFTKILKKLSLYSVVAVMAIVTLVPTASAYSYYGSNGQSYRNADFLSSNTYVSATQSDGVAKFCLQDPGKDFDGYAIYVKEGSFIKSLTAYTPIYQGKYNNCVTYKVQNSNTVSLRAYAYINLTSGARKFIQPGYQSSIYVPVKKYVPQPQPIPQPQPPVVQMSCGNSSGADGLYSACKGDTIFHESGMNATIQYYNNYYVKLYVAGAWPHNVYLIKNKVKELQIKNGTRLDLTYSETSDKYGAFIDVKTTKGPEVLVSQLPAVNLYGYSPSNGKANIDWNDLNGLGDSFDKYHIKWTKGWVNNFNNGSYAKSYVSYGSYYNLTGLSSGWWTFQVVPTKNAQEVGANSKVVHVYVK